MKQEKVPIVTPQLDQRFACLKYDNLPKAKKMKKKHGKPSWFYSNNSSSSPRNILARENTILPGIGARLEKPNPVRNELEKLERIQDWLRRSYRSPVGINYTSEDDDDDDLVSEGYLKEQQPVTRSVVNKSSKSGPAKIYRSQDSEEEHIAVKSHASEPMLPKLGMFTNLTGQPEVIVGTGVKSYYKPGVHKLVGEGSGQKERVKMEDGTHVEPRFLPGDLTADEYLQKRSKTYFGLNSSFSIQQTSQQQLRRHVGPIQRPHVESPMGDVLVRQKTRFGDTMMHAKSPSKAFTDQRGRTYMLHAKLKDMLLEP